jgi:hypothetical protein
MTETAGAGEAKRLDELAAVTAEYARYSRFAFGFANVAAGVWVGLGAAVQRASHEWGSIVLALTPLLYVELLPRARAFYQERGEVIAREQGPDLRSGYLLFVITYAVMAALTLTLHLHRWAFAGGALRVAALGVAGVALVSVLVRARRATRGTGDTMMVYLLLIPVGGALAWGERGSMFWLVVLFCCAGGFVIAGALQHVGHRRLERRLAALRSPAA